jgi:glutamate dehydrogenase
LLRIKTSRFHVSSVYTLIDSKYWLGFLAGELVADGTDFRNGAHLRYKADIFVPCGGRYVIPIQSIWLWTEDILRPEAINISNVGKLIDKEGKPHFKYIVEGANLFLTQQARLFLEKRKVVVFKDASTNKGKPSAAE